MNEQEREVYIKCCALLQKIRYSAQDNCRCDSDVGLVCELCHDAAVLGEFMRIFDRTHDRMIEIESEVQFQKECARDLAKYLLNRKLKQ